MMPPTFVVTVPIVWSLGMGVVYTAWVVLLTYKLYRFVVGLFPSN